MFRLFRLSRFSFGGLLAAVFWMQSVGSLAALHLRDINGAPTAEVRSAEFAYDDLVDATWYLKPLSPGLPWDEAKAWAENLSVGVFDDWSLPSALNPDGSGPCVARGCQSQVGLLWGVTLGNGTFGIGQPGLRATRFGPFRDLPLDAYWLAEQYSGNPESAWYFDFAYGSQDAVFKNGARYALAIRPGDVAAVPEPSAGAMFVLGAAALLVFELWRKRRSDARAIRNR